MLFHRLAAQQGWTDALRTLHPGERIYTFWDYFRNAYARDAGLRIDHLMLSPSLAPRLMAAGVDREVRGWEKASDHAPVWIELAVPTRAAEAKPALFTGGRVKWAYGQRALRAEWIRPVADLRCRRRSANGNSTAGSPSNRGLFPIQPLGDACRIL